MLDFEHRGCLDQDKMSKPDKIRKIVLIDEKDDKNIIHLEVKIDDDGKLVFEGHDLGEIPEKYWGDSDYEYWLIIDEDYKDTILLWLIKERFRNDSEFKEWLNEKGIPSQFYSWI